MTALGNKTWIGGNAEWATDSDWSPLGAPGSTDAAVLSNGATITVGSSDFAALAGTLTVNSGRVAIEGGALALSGLSVAAGGSLIVDSYGSLVTGSSGLGGNVYSQTGDVTLQNGGNFSVQNYLTGTVSGTVYIESGSTYSWQDGQSSGSTGNIVDFAGSGGGTFQESQAWGGTVRDFNSSNQNLLSFGGSITSFTYSAGTKTLTVHTASTTYTIKFADNSTALTAANFYEDAVNNPSTISYAGTPHLPPNPTVSSSRYNAATGVLTLTGSNFTTAAGDFDPTALTLSGEDGVTYTLTGGTITGTPTTTSFAVTLTAADQLAVDGLLNADGTSTTSPFSPGYSFSYGLSTTSNFDTSHANPTSGTPVTVSNALNPQITSVAYDRVTGVFTLTGTGFENEGTSYGLNAAFFTITGQGGSGASYTLQTYDTPLVTSMTTATFTLTDPDLSSVNALLDANGTSSSGGVIYNLAATSGWDAEAGAAITTQPITVGGASAPPTVVSIDRTSTAALTGAGSDSFTVTFNTAVTGVASGNFSLSGSDGTAVANAAIGTPTTSDGGTTWTVIVSGVSGDGTLGLDLSTVGGITAVPGGTPLAASHGADQTYTVDTTAPAVAFDSTPSVFDGAATTVLTGTVADANGLASVAIYNGTVDPAGLVGTATVSGGTWSLSTTLPPGDYANLMVVATDNAGNTTTANASYELLVGLSGPYAAQENDYTNGQLVSSALFGTTGILYLAENFAPDGQGGSIETSAGGSLFNGRPYASFAFGINQAGHLVSEALYTDTNRQSLYLEGAISRDGHGGAITSFSSGSFFNGKSFDAYAVDRNAGSVIEKIRHNRNGSHAITGYRDGLTFNAINNDRITGGGSGETFVFSGNFGLDVIKDLAAHLSDPGHDTISITSFANFDALVAATHDDAFGNAVIAVSPGNTLRLIDVSKSDVISHSGDFVTAHGIG